MTMASETDAAGQVRGFSLDQLGRYMRIEGITGNRITGRIYDPVPENLAALKDVFRAAGNIAYFERTPDGHAITYGYPPPHRRRRQRRLRRDPATHPSASCSPTAACTSRRPTTWV